MKFKFWDKILEKNSKKIFNKTSRKNLFIFPNYKGFQVGALVFFCFAVAIFYQNNFALLLSIIIFFIFFISIIFSYQNLLNLNFKLLEKFYPSGKIFKLKFLVENNDVREKLNINFEIDNEIIKKDFNNSNILSFSKKFNKRGTYDVPFINVFSFFPFGIIKTFSRIFLDEKLIIYPQPIKPPTDLFTKLYEMNNKEGFDFEFDQIEEIRFPTNYSKISWKHYTLKNKFYEKKFKFLTNNQNIVIDIEKLLQNNFEKTLNYVSFFINDFYKQKIPFSLKYKNYSSQISCSLEHLNKQLYFLANVKN